jgi:hypothetical protein
MTHNGDSRPDALQVRIDSKTKKKLLRYENEWGVGHCVLGAICFYIGLIELEKLEEKIMFVYGKPANQILSKIIENEKRSCYMPFSSMFLQEGIPEKLGKDVMISLNEKAKEMSKSIKKVEVVENE